MHLHANSLNILATSLQTAAVAEKAAAVQRANEVRRKLAKSALELHTLSQDGSMAGQWDGDARRQPRQNRQWAEPAVRAMSEAEEEPLSFWA